MTCRLNGRALRLSGQFVLLIGAISASYMVAWGDEPERVRKRPSPTYSKDVLPIIQMRCLDCHRRNHVGPFALETYEQARKRAFDIAAVAGDRSMPPWKPVSGFGPRLKHDPSLTSEEVAMLAAWSDAGAPRGEEKDRPLPRHFTDGWTLGTPDLVLEMTEDFQVPASGPDLYRCFVIPTNLRKEVAVSAVEYMPGNRRVVHHMMAFLDSTGAGRDRDRADPGPGYTSFSGAGVEVEGDLGGWAAGNVPHRLPDGIGRVVPARSDVLLQVHYHPSGKPSSIVPGWDCISARSQFARPSTGPTPPTTHSDCRRVKRTSWSRQAGTSRSTSRRWRSLPTCISLDVSSR